MIPLPDQFNLCKRIRFFADLLDGFQTAMKVRVKSPEGEIQDPVGENVRTEATLKCAFGSTAHRANDPLIAFES